ncbi:hypothetical protein AAZX31_05G083800 [Glycine max]|nr:hypothetical protein GLYMA_05G084375v4 [Glycine max]KAH1133511.1 hypothetical protein GYH30_012063 [Glycine max]
MKGVTIWALFLGIGFGLFLCNLGGGQRRPPSGGEELLVRYHSRRVRILTLCEDLRAEGQSQVDKGLPKGNGRVQRFPRARQRLSLECKGRRELDCKTHPSSREESRP